MNTIYPKISIITPSHNQGDYIEDTILSVVNQNYANFEHIIIDGGSTDQTISILKKYPHLNWISEKDNGQSHAINKGFRMATGEIIAWLNSDDCYDKNCFFKVSNFFTQNPSIKILYGDITYVSNNSIPLASFKGDNINFKSIKRNPDLIRQPSTFWRRSIFYDIGYIDENLHMIMDYEFFLRVFIKFTPGYIPENLSFFRYHSLGKTSNYIDKQIDELKIIMPKYSKFWWFWILRLILYRKYIEIISHIMHEKKK